MALTSRTCLPQTPKVKKSSWTKNQILSSLGMSLGLKTATKTCLYHMHTLWLFTKSDLKSILAPTLAFGFLSAQSNVLLVTPPLDNVQLLSRSGMIFAWGWINLFLLCINNQRKPIAIEEDKINKPWRPLPSGRLSSSQATHVMLGALPVGWLISAYTGGFYQFLLLVLLNVWYNELGGGDNVIFRNLINAIGFTLYNSAALDILSGGKARSWDSSISVQWLGTIGAIVLATIHIQDLRDQEGDRARNRTTMPLKIGDWPCRLTLTAAITGASFFALRFWNFPTVGCGLVVFLSGLLAWRLLTKRSACEDSQTFKSWSLWLVSLYALPIMV